MKRKYDVRNKRNIIIIMVLSLLVIGIFSLFILKYMKTSKIFYEIPLGSVLQDVDKNYLEVEDDAMLKMRWNDNYYLDYQDKRVTFGKKVISYNTITGGMKLYGNIYEIKENGKIDSLKGETVIDNVSEAKFYKLADREYLLVDRTVISEDRGIEASNYMLVELDKLGNAKLSNNKLELKTITKTILLTSKYKFDIANEILTYGDKTIDLKKIIGTSNEYVPEDDDKNGDDKTNTDGSSINNQGSNSGSNQNGGNGTIINSNDDGEEISIDEIKNKTKMTSVVRIFEGLSQIEFDYVVYDPYNEYRRVYVEIYKDRTIETIELSKSETHLVVSGLNPDSEYRFKFIYKTLDKETEEEVVNTFDEMTLRTKKPNYSVEVTKISRVNNTLTYRVKIDDEYATDRVLVNMSFSYNYIDPDSLEISKRNVSVNQELTINNGSKYVMGSFDIKDYDIDMDTLIKLKIVEVYSGDFRLNIGTSYTFRLGRSE